MTGDSDSEYVPTGSDRVVTSSSPVGPLIVAGPLAASVHEVAVAVRPSPLSRRFFTSVSFGRIAVFVIVHVTSSPRRSRTLAAVCDDAPVHSHVSPFA